MQVSNDQGQKVWKPLRQTECRHLIKGIAKGLKHLHDMPMAHGDLKLANVLLFRKPGSSDERAGFESEFDRFIPKLADFGQSRMRGTEEPAPDDPPDRIMMHRPMCTLHYAAPESWYGTKRYDMLIADCFSLGVCLLAMLLGAHPYSPTIMDEPRRPDFVDTDAYKEKKTQYAKLLNTSKKDVLFTEHLCANFPALLRQALVGLLDPNPETRMQVTEFLNHTWLRQIAQDTAELASRSSSLPRAQQRSRSGSVWPGTHQIR